MIALLRADAMRVWSYQVAEVVTAEDTHTSTPPGGEQGRGEAAKSLGEERAMTSFLSQRN